MYSRYLLLFFFSLGQYVVSQQAIHNFGNLQLHQKGQLGFHSDLINDGSFENNLGLMGFYDHEEGLTISGAFTPTFHDLELALDNDLLLDVTIRVDNSLSFIYGNIQTPRKYRNVYANFSEDAIYSGLVNQSKIDGYAAVTDQKSFRFPVGQGAVSKPLHIQFVDGVFLAKCAYFMENPGNPKSFAESFDLNNRDQELGIVCPQEFWNLKTSGRIQITLDWDEQTNLSFYTEDLTGITVAGWNILNKEWQNLGNAKIEGDLGQGSVMSHIFNANDYEIFTYGFINDPDKDKPGNYAITPNGDGINDNFSLKIIEQSPNNTLQIYNRAGLLVYEKTNYKNEFKGVGNRNILFRNNLLPEGVYFYLLELKDINRSYQGYFYLSIE
ncbi:gliding motility-associated C-terminal domain-containing protein [Flavobacteriaceae bacterium D16]|nr:gliding motility-associated C-terminal domain-containing protein [Flavobacteriaceae bacterium D16]